MKIRDPQVYSLFWTHNQVLSRLTYTIAHPLNESERSESLPETRFKRQNSTHPHGKKITHPVHGVYLMRFQVFPWRLIGVHRTILRNLVGIFIELLKHVLHLGFTSLRVNLVEALNLVLIELLTVILHLRECTIDITFLGGDTAQSVT